MKRSTRNRRLGDPVHDLAGAGRGRRARRRGLGGAGISGIVLALRRGVRIPPTCSGLRQDLLNAYA